MKKPDNVNIAGGLLLASGIMSLLVILGLALGTIGIACLWPPIYYGIGSAIYAIVRGSKLLGPHSYGSGVPRASAIMQIVQLINGDMFGMGLGIAALVLLGGPEVAAWLEGTVPMTQPGQGYGQQSFGQQGFGQQAAPAVAPVAAQGGWAAPTPASAPPAAPAWESAPAAPAQGGWGAPSAAPPSAAPPQDPWSAPPSDPWGAPPAQSSAPASGGPGYSVAAWGEAPAAAAAGAAAAAAAASNPAHRHTVVEQAIDASKPPAESVASAGGWGGGWGDPDKKGEG